MDALGAAVGRLATETAFSGAVRVDIGGEVVLEVAYGPADRAHGIDATAEHQFGLASGTKGLTALTVVSLVDEGSLDLDTSARTVFGDDLPLIPGDVTVGHLLSHRSGIGDYLDEEADGDINDHIAGVVPHELVETTDYLPLIDGIPPASAAGERFAYCNRGYVVLALIAERVGGVPFAELVRQRVCEPAGMVDTEFLRSDELPGRAAKGYLGATGLRTNVLHLPVRGSGDGGIYSTVADVHRLWDAFFGHRIVSERWVEQMTRPSSDDAGPGKAYGLGFWLASEGSAVMLEGYDPGVSFRTVRHRSGAFTHTVISNTSEGAWPMTRLLDQLVAI